MRGNDQKVARVSPLFRSHRRRWGAALIGGLALHAAVVAYAAGLRPASPLPVVALASFGEVLLVPHVQPPQPPAGESGGGSMEPGEQEKASGNAPKPEKPVVAAVKADKRPQKPAEPEPPPLPLEELEHGNADEAEPNDLFALDQMLTAEQGDELLAIKHKPKPAWRSSLTRPDAKAAPMAGDNATMSKHYGIGPGRGGGSGGSGRGPNPTRTSGTPFGGDRGEFTGQVCFIAPRTPSIRRMGSCVVQLVLHTSSFNLPMTHFTEGFPGIDRDEWFAILYSGKFNVSKAGLHRFRLASDDGSILSIDGQEVVDNDGQHGPLAKRGEMELSAGEHSFELRYFQGPRALVSLQLWVTPPGESERLFGPTL